MLTGGDARTGSEGELAGDTSAGHRQPAGRNREQQCCRPVRGRCGRERYSPTGRRYGKGW